ncbi:MAG TPA: chemotaxis protein CheW [Pseudomonadales bacterium]|nr:chemotaxis protein CheW [Pseudomonadales bacterium]
MSNAEVPSLSPSAQPAAARPVRDVPSMLLPVQDKMLLIPGVAVAEIVNYSYPDCPAQAPDWFLGYIEWRKLSVPLVSFELLNGQAMPRATGTPRIAVINNTGINDALPFIAIVLQGIPRLMRIMPQDITEANQVALSPAELAAMQLSSGEVVLIPDVSVLEKAYSDYLQAR